MKKQIFVLVALLTPYVFVYGQDYTVNVTKKDEPSEKVTTVYSEDLDDYEVSVFLEASKEVINQVDTYDIKQKHFLNGKEVHLELWSRLSKTDDGTALKENFDLSSIIEQKANWMKEKGNVLKVAFMNEDGTEMAQAEIKFDIPGYNDYKSDFCGDLFTLKGDDNEATTMVKSLFKVVYPKAEILEILMNDEWNVTEGYGGMNTYMIIYKDNENLKYIKYSASYSLEDGKLMSHPRVRIYNGFIDGWSLSPSCYENLKADLK